MQTGRRQPSSLHGNTAENRRIGTQVVEHEIADQGWTIPTEQPELEADEGHRQLGAHRAAEHPPAIGAEPGRDIQRQDRQPAGVDRLDRFTIGTAHLAAESGAEQRIYQHALQRSPGNPRQDGNPRRLRRLEGQTRIASQTLRIADGQHPHRPAGLLRQRRQQIAIAGVVAAAGQHIHARGLRPAAAQRPPRSLGGALHQLETSRAGGNQASIEVTDLRGAVQHGRKLIPGLEHVDGPVESMPLDGGGLALGPGARRYVAWQCRAVSGRGA